MVSQFIILFTQVAQVIFRTWNIAAISREKKWIAHISFSLYGITWLVATSHAVKALISLDFLNITIWILGGVIGQEIGLRLKKQ